MKEATKILNAHRHVLSQLKRVGLEDLSDFVDVGIKPFGVYLGYYSYSENKIIINRLSLSAWYMRLKGCDTSYSSTLRHEYGHVFYAYMEDYIDLDEFDDIFMPSKIFDRTKYVSPYCLKSPEEDFAEMFDIVIGYSRLPSRFDYTTIRRKAEYIKRLINEW